jgi:hypothetical protein
MFEIIAAQYPRLCRAMRRTHGIPAHETAQLIMAARFPGRVAIWTATPCSKARALIADAFTSRPRAIAR